MLSSIAPNSAPVVVRQHYTFENIANEEREDWIGSCPHRAFNPNATWVCGSESQSTTSAECNRYSGCEWRFGQCVESTSFPREHLCCSRGNWSRIGRTNTSRGTRVSLASGGWLSSFSDVTVMHGGGTVDELEEYIESDTYLTDESPLIAAAIVFERVDGDNWEYSIRMNSSFVSDAPSTNEDPVNYLETQVQMGSTFGYVQSHGPSFMALQLLVDRYILRAPVQEDVDIAQALTDSRLEDLCPDLNCPQLAEPLLFSPYRLIFTGLPFPPSTRQDYYEFVSDWLALVFIIVYMHSLYNAAQTFGLEKESKLREALRMQGVSTCALTSSWVLALGLQYYTTALLMAIASKLYLFEKASFALMFLGYWSSLIALMALAWCLHTPFHKAKTGGMVTAVVFVGAYPLWKSINSAGISPILRLVGQLHPGCAVCFVIQSLSLLEGAANGVTANSTFTPIKGSSFGEAVTMLIVDCCLLTCIGSYLELVLAKEFGTRLPACFCCERSFWSSTAAALATQPIVPLAAIDTCEAPSPAEQEMEGSKECIAIRGLCKTFGDFAAVHELSLTMYEGQIFSLLGKNGAGKTTTINMITGVLEPTKGDAVVYGRSVVSDMAEIRRDIGTCFQHDVLFPTLTVSEHLLLFAGLRGIPSVAVPTAVQAAIGQVGLTEKTHVKAEALSGGMKRKLSLSIALIGGPRCCFLDEPTSGMDPFSRRFTWDMLQQSRKGRTIILTTHFLEEAELLGDRIGIMSHGELCCCGSSLFLKKRFSQGYDFTLETSADCDHTALEATICQHIPELGTSAMNSNAKEMRVQLPMSALPKFSTLFAAIDASKTELGVIDYGISTQSIETVFMNQTKGSAQVADGETAAMLETDDEIEPFDIRDKSSNVAAASRAPICCTHIRALYIKRFHYGRRDKRSLITSLLIPIFVLVMGLEVMKNSLRQSTEPSFVLDYSNSFDWGAEPHVPVYTVGTSPLTQAVERVRGAQPQQPSGAASGSIFGNEYEEGCPIEASGGDGRSLEPTGTIDWDDGAWEAGCSVMFKDYINNGSAVLAAPTLALSQDMLTDGLDAAEKSEVRFGAMVALESSPVVSVLLNTTAFHAAPIFLNALSMAYADSQTSITVRNAPLPVTKAVDTAFDQLSAIFAVLLIIIAFSFVPASIVVYVVKEREKERNSKHQQVISGVSIPAYWIANFLWDMTLYCIPLAFTMLVVLAYDLPAFSGVHCQDWNTSSPLANPLEHDFFQSETNCSVALAQYPADQQLLPYYGRCVAINTSDVAAVARCSSVEIPGENVPWNAAACTAVSLAADEWDVCMDTTRCKKEVEHAMRPGQSFGGIFSPPEPFPPLEMTPELAAVAARVLEQQQLVEDGEGDEEQALESECTLEMVRFSRPFCELSNGESAAKSPPLPLQECNATLSDVCPVSAGACPVSRTVGTFLLFLGFGVAIVPFSYLLAFCFQRHTVAQVFSIIVTFAIGLLLSLVSMMLDTLPFEDPELAASNREKKWLYRLFSPGYALGNGLLDMAFSSFGVSLGADQGARLLVAPSDPLAWDNSGKDIGFLFLSAPVREINAFLSL